MERGAQASFLFVCCWVCSAGCLWNGVLETASACIRIQELKRALADCLSPALLLPHSLNEDAKKKRGAYTAASENGANYKAASTHTKKGNQSSAATAVCHILVQRRVHSRIAMARLSSYLDVHQRQNTPLEYVVAHFTLILPFLFDTVYHTLNNPTHNRGSNHRPENTPREQVEGSSLSLPTAYRKTTFSTQNTSRLICRNCWSLFFLSGASA